MRVMNGNGANAHGNFVSGLVVQKADHFGGVRSLDGAGDGTILRAEFATRLIAVQQRFAVANDFVAPMPRDAFGAITPEDNSLLQVDDAETDGQAFDNVASGLGIVKNGHKGLLSYEWTQGLSAKSTGASGIWSGGKIGR